MTIAPASSSTNLNDVGYVDQSAIATLPAMVSISRQLAAYQQQLNGRYAAAMRSAHGVAERQRANQQLQSEFVAEQRSLEGPALERVQLAIASVASTQGLSVVVDKRIVIYGGVDITQQVVRLLQSSQQILPLGTQPPPSEIGYVDQAALANSPQVKAASAQLATYAEKERRYYGLQFQQAGSNAQKQQQIAQAYNKAMSDEQDQLLKPVVDHAQAVTAQVAQHKGLLLVVDHADILYGGTDITPDVQDALNK
ncbi:MAG TPA: OmpH family outer membrane protein [Polyangiales bacterium]|nr:OmpH family outer membrane protein [Polyangiales bacterium]